MADGKDSVEAVNNTLIAIYESFETAKELGWTICVPKGKLMHALEENRYISRKKRGSTVVCVFTDIAKPERNDQSVNGWFSRVYLQVKAFAI